MEIRTLRYFLAVAREENMTRAAEVLHVTQPTLSKALKTLEEELGKKLFIRHSFSIRLTEEGVLLRNRAEDLKEIPLFCSEQAWNGDIRRWGRGLLFKAQAGRVIPAFLQWIRFCPGGARIPADLPPFD